MKTMLILESPFLSIIVRTAVIYFAILIGLRVAGKREIGQMTVFDLVVLLLIANAVQNAMVGPDTSLTGGLIAAFSLLVLNYLVATLRLRWAGLRHLIEGTPTLLVLHGKVLHANLRREGLDDETLEAAVREHGLANLKDVEMAVLETDGSISVVPVGSEARLGKKPVKFLSRH